MNFQGTEISKEQIQTSERLAKALLEVAKVVHPDPAQAVQAIVGCGIGILVDFTNKDIPLVRSIVNNYIDMIIELMPKVQRTLNGPNLKVVPDGNEEKTP